MNIDIRHIIPLFCLLLASCADSEEQLLLPDPEPQPAVAIAFGGSMDGDGGTRAVITLSNYTDYAFLVYGLYTNTHTYPTAADSLPTANRIAADGTLNFIQWTNLWPACLTYNSAEEHWEYSPLATWPTDNADSLSFFAIMTGHETGKSTTTLPAGFSVAYGTLPDATGDNQDKPLRMALYADGDLTVGTHGDLLVANAFNRSVNYGKGEWESGESGNLVSFSFKHVLSNIKAIKITNSTGVAITLTAVKMAGTFPRGNGRTYLLLDENPIKTEWHNMEYYTYNDVDINGSSKFKYESFTPVNLSNGATATVGGLPADGLWFLPGRADIRIRVGYKVDDEPHYKTVQLTGATTFNNLVVGKRYTFTINLTGDATEDN